jgi:ankyrin repeat protein
MHASARPFRCPQEGNTPLHIATKRGWPGIISKLLDLGANIEAKNNSVFRCP